MKRWQMIGLVVMAMCSCQPVELVNPVPNYPVNLELNITAEYPHFTSDNVGSHLCFYTPRYPNDRVGYAGVVAFVYFDQAYCAFDLCCPNCLKRDQPLTIDGIYAQCPVCGEQYDMSFGLGVPQRGISQHYLKRYATREVFSAGVKKLIISN